MSKNLINNKPTIAVFYSLSVFIIILDQVLKLLVHYNMDLGEEFKILGLDWLKIHYTENPGLAFGVNLEWKGFKSILTVFRIIASGWIIYYIWDLYHNKLSTHIGYIWCLALILGGAIGNVIDSIFYGVFLGNTVPGASMEWFHGQVIDMFFFDIWHDYIGSYYLSIWPVFNVADSSIFIGVVFILIFQKKFFIKKEDKIETIE